MAVLVQSATGHLNGWPRYPFDQEECYARATFAATRSQSLTVIVSPIGMMGIMGMIQVLAARAHPIAEVHQTNSNWTMPALGNGETQLEQSDQEIASWRLDHAGTWAEQIEPPLAVFYMETKFVRGVHETRPMRLRLILVPASDVRGATQQMETLDPCSGWAPKTKNEPNTMVLRHWLMPKLMPTFPLPGIYFFDVTAVDLMHDEEMPQEPDAPDTTPVDRLLQRQAVLTARADAKTAAECAMEVSHVVQLTEALLEAEAVIEESTAARHHYLNVQKEHEDNLEQQGGHKRRATGSTRRRTPAPEAPLPIHVLSHEGSPELPRRVVDKVLGNLQHLPDSSDYAIWRRFLHLKINREVIHAQSLGWCAACAKMNMTRVEDLARSNCEYVTCTYL